MRPDVVVAGGGIAGSAVAMLLARAGSRVELFERGEFPREKPCGEGIMPAGVAVLGRLGLLGSVGGMPFRGVRYHVGDRVATGPFPHGEGVPREGLAQRRAVIDRVLFEAAAATPGVRAHIRAEVTAPLVERGRVTGLVVNGLVRRAGLTIAADGAHSRLRRALGLTRPARRRRLGMRAHFRLAPGADAPPWVDVFLGAGHELYVAALPHGEMVVAALAEVRDERSPAEVLFERWWRAQPRLAERLRGARRLTALRGALPLGLQARRGFVPGMVLLGDAAGSLDPITGCGMTQALVSAEILASWAVRGLVGSDDLLPEFERARRRRLRDSALLTRGLLWLSRHPAWVPPALDALGAWPTLFSHLVGVAGGARSLSGLGGAAHASRAARDARTRALKPMRSSRSAQAWVRHTGTVVFLVVALAGPAVATAQTRDSTGVLLAAGDSSVARLDLAAATAAYSRAHRANPGSYEAAWKLARALADQATLTKNAGEQERLCREAESLARAAIAIDPRGVKGHVFLAIALGKLALFVGGKRKVRLSREIESEASAALALDPNDDLAHHVLGVWNREVAEVSGLLRFFAKVLYGGVPHGTLEASLDHLGKARSLHPEVLPHHVELGMTLASARRYREAQQELEDALRMPTSWVTDDYYRAKARTALADVRRHVGPG